MNKKVGICLIGCGRAGMIHAENYVGKVKNAKLVALCDKCESSLAEAQKETGVDKIYTDYHEALKDAEVDAVVIVVPTQFHRDIVIAAARSGKHVFCEKPMASTEDECDEMIEACNRHNVKLQIGFMRRFDKNFRRGKELIDDGSVGKVTLIKSNTYGPSQPREWMYDIEKSYGPIGEVNSHDFDTLRWYAGSEVKSIYAIGHNFRSPEKTEEYPDYYDTCSVLLEFENGVIGTITGAQYVKYGYDSRAEILGTGGIIKVGSQRTNEVEYVTSKQCIKMDSMDSWRTLFKDAYMAEANAFADCIVNDTKPQVTGYDGKMAFVLVNEGLKSILEKRTIEIKYDRLSVY